MWLGATYREMRDSGFSFRPEEAMRHRFWLIWVSQRERGETLGGSRNPLRGFDDSFHRHTVNDQRLCCLQSATHIGIALDDRWTDYADLDGPRRGCDPEEIERRRSMIASSPERGKRTQRTVGVSPQNSLRSVFAGRQASSSPIRAAIDEMVVDGENSFESSKGRRVRY